jgi:hypothetical protein
MNDDDWKKIDEKVGPSAESIDNNLLAFLKKRRKSTFSLTALSDALDRGPSVVRAALARLRDRGYSIKVTEGDAGGIAMDSVPLSSRPNTHIHDLTEYAGQWVRFGVCGDKHLGNMHSRLDVMELLYSLYEAEGITTVYDTGNWIDGECRFNKGELLASGMDGQLDYMIDNHPQRKGITTYMVAGDDHEGWYQQRECLEIGRYMQLRAKDSGRDDLQYLGYAEALIELKAARGSRWMMVNHPGGGSSYAVSYTSQKYVESLQGGEKPAVILQGHYHKINFGFPREVFVVDTGTCCDQTLFMRKKKLQAHVGGWIVELMQAPDGRILRFRPEFFPFYDRGFYEHNRRHFGLPKRVSRKAI